MDTSRSEGSLLEEIKFLTNLIQMHHNVEPAVKAQQSPIATKLRNMSGILKKKHSWTPAGSSYAGKGFQPAAVRYPHPSKQWQSKNKVYRPPREVAVPTTTIVEENFHQNSPQSSLTSFHPPLDHSTPQGSRAGPASKLYLPPKQKAVQQVKSPPASGSQSTPLTNSPPIASNTWKSILPLSGHPLPLTGIKLESPSNLPSNLPSSALSTAQSSGNTKGCYRPRRRRLRSAGKAKRKQAKSESPGGGVSSGQRLVLTGSPDRVVIAVPPPATVGSVVISPPAIGSLTIVSTGAPTAISTPTRVVLANPVPAMANPVVVANRVPAESSPPTVSNPLLVGQPHTAPGHPVPPTNTAKPASKRIRRRRRGRKGKGQHAKISNLPSREQLKWQRQSVPLVGASSAATSSATQQRLRPSAGKRKAKLKQPSIKRSKNRVWVAPDNETEIVFITPKPPSEQQPVPTNQAIQPESQQDKPAPEPVARDVMVSGNAIEQALEAALRLTELVDPIQLVGREKKTKQGNKQWVAGSMATPSCIKKGMKRKNSKSKGKSSLVSISGGSYAMDSSKRRLKRLSSSSLYSKHTGALLGGRYAVDATGKRLKRLSSFSLHSKHAGFTPRLRYTVDTSVNKRKQLPNPRRKRSLVSIDGGRYSMDSSGKKLKRVPTPLKSKHLVSISGARYAMDPSRRRLKRLSMSSQPTSWSPAITSYIGGVANSTSSVKRMLANRVVKKSKAYVWYARRKKQLDKSKQFCLFFNRFGKCNKGKDCPYIHDPDKIAVCTRFLKGTCDKMDGSCLFSHKISKEKMPVCSFFLRGVCGREDCPYLHVSVGRDAEVCPDFLKGYCPRGEQCTKQHTLDCPKFAQTGSCPDGAKCPLRHLTRPPKEEAGPVPLVKEPHAFKKVRYNIARVKASQALRGVVAPSGEEGGGEVEEEEVFGSGSVSPITVRELDFLPLDVNAGKLYWNSSRKAVPFSERVILH